MQSLKRLALVAVLCALPGLGRAAFDKGGVLGVGARATGMGSAFVAIADDNTATFWNPAGLVQLPRMEASAFIGPLLNGKEYYLRAPSSCPSWSSTALGFSVVSLYHDTGDSKTDAYENQYIASFATPLNVEKTVSIGLNLKFLQYSSGASATISSTGQTIEAVASGVGMDLGGLYQVLLPSWGKKVNFGFLAQDLSTTLRWESGVEETVPLLIQTGVAYYPEENLVFSVDYSFFNDTNISGEPLDTPLYDPSTGQTVTTLQPDQSRPHVGIEGWFFNGHLGLRTGYTGFATTADQFTAGVSYKQNAFDVDYAYMGHAEHLGDSHRLSVHFDFGPGAERPRVVALVNPPTDVVRPPQQQLGAAAVGAQPGPPRHGLHRVHEQGQRQQLRAHPKAHQGKQDRDRRPDQGPALLLCGDFRQQQLAGGGEQLFQRGQLRALAPDPRRAQPGRRRPGRQHQQQQRRSSTLKAGRCRWARWPATTST